MTTIPSNIFVYATAALVFTGAFSRITHGQFTPRYYAYQEYHQPDDGSRTAQIVPLMDAVLGSMLFVGRTKVFAAILIDIFMVIGFIVQMIAGKRVGIDLVMVATATGAVWQTWRSEYGLGQSNKPPIRS